MLVKGLAKKYKKRIILDSINWDIGHGVVGLIGPDGSGKSTLLKILSGTIRPSHGDVTIDDIKLSSNPDEYRAKIGYLPESFTVHDHWTIDEFIHTVAVYKGIHSAQKRNMAVEEILKKLGLWECRRRKMKVLPIGIKQRVGLAQAILNKPDVLILDEPVAGLNAAEKRDFYDLICQYGKKHTVIFSSRHAENVFRSCRYIGILNAGQLLFKGTLREVAKKGLIGSVDWNSDTLSKGMDAFSFYDDFVSGYRSLIGGY